jgi:hypothetical protein
MLAGDAAPVAVDPAGTGGCVVAACAVGGVWLGVALAPLRRGPGLAIEPVALREPPGPSLARVSIPEVSIPEVSIPEVSIPDVSNPGVSIRGPGASGFVASGPVAVGGGSAEGTRDVSVGTTVALCIVPMTGAAGDDAKLGAVPAVAGAAGCSVSGVMLSAAASAGLAASAIASARAGAA